MSNRLHTYPTGYSEKHAEREQSYPSYPPEVSSEPQTPEERIASAQKATLNALGNLATRQDTSAA